jgi:putative oxidoreductase
MGDILPQNRRKSLYSKNKYTDKEGEKGVFMEFLKDLFIFAGRICISASFLWASYEMIKNWSETKAIMTEKNVPRLEIALPSYLALKVIGALLVFLGWQAHLGALMLLVATIPAALHLHPFWKLHGKEKIIEQTIFMRDVSIIGGLLLLLASGSGSFSA